MRRNIVEMVLNICFWMITGWLIVCGFSIVSQDIEIVDGVKSVRVVRSGTMIIQLLVSIGVSAFIFYGNFFNILRLKHAVPLNHVVWLSLSLILLQGVVNYFAQSPRFFPGLIPLPTIFAAGIPLFYFTISTAYAIGKVWIHAEQQRQHLNLEKKKAELSLLRNQLHPHFLFNVLNNLVAMVDQPSSPLLTESLYRLSDLLRYVVHEARAGAVFIKKEIDFLQNFADLQLLRFEKGEVNFELKVKGTCDHQMIEPGIFIPFVENAFKHGTEPERHSDIRVVFDLTNPSEIRFCIQNPIFPRLASNRYNGTGIKNARERLRLVYPNRHELRITNEKSCFKVKLNLTTHAGNNSR